MSKFEELVKKGADTPEPALVFPRLGIPTPVLCTYVMRSVFD